MGEFCKSPLVQGRECLLKTKECALVVTVLGMSDNLVWVSYPAAVPLIEGEGVELEVASGNGRMGYHMRIAAGPSQRLEGLLLERVESTQPIANRRDWRVPTKIPVWLRDVYHDEAIRGTMRDLSSKGALIRCRGHYEPFDVVELTFRLPGYQVRRLTARIAYSGIGDSSRVKRYGLNFIDIPRNAREALMWFLYEEIHERYQQELRDLYPHPGVSREVPEAKVLEPSEIE